MADTAVKKVFKVSCLGCVVVVVLGLVTLGTLGWISSRAATFADATARHDAAEIGASDPLDVADFANSPEFATTGTDGVNRVVLEVEGVAKVTVHPCDPGSGLAVDASYNEKRFEFSETLNQDPGGRWDYNVTMRRRGSSLMQWVEQVFTRRESTLDLCLPAEVPIDLDLDVVRGGVEVQLGGLWLPRVELSMDRGGAFIDFDRPLRVPAQSLTFRTNMGGAYLRRLGNASPAELNVEYQFGGYNIDLAGEWKRDSTISLQGGASGVTVALPGTVRVEGAPGLESSSAPEGAPTLTFAPGTDFEKVTLTRR